MLLCLFECEDVGEKSDLDERKTMEETKRDEENIKSGKEVGELTTIHVSRNYQILFTEGGK